MSDPIFVPGARNAASGAGALGRVCMKEHGPIISPSASALEAPESWPRRGEAALADRLDRSADPEGWPYGRRQRNPLLSGLRGGAGVGFSYSHAELHVTVDCLAPFVTAVGV